MSTIETPHTGEIPEPSRTFPTSLARDVPERAIVAGLALVFLFLFGWGSWSYPLWDPWEPKYAQAVRDMQERGDFITPYLHDKIRWTKPILIYWAMYPSTLLFGNNEFTVRIPTILGAVMGVLLTYYWASRLRGRRTGILAAAILGTLPQYFYMSRQAMPDMLLVAFVGSAMGFLALARFVEARRRFHFGCFYACLGLAFLTKGPLAPALTLGAVGLFWLIDIKPERLLSPRTVWSDFRGAWRDYHVNLGLIIVLAIAGPWYLAMLIKHGFAFIDNFILDENIKRFKQPLFGHDGDSTHYFSTMFHGMYPWFSILPIGLAFLFHGHSRIDDEMRQKWYFLSWLLAVFLIVTCAGTKLDHYIFPSTPAVAMLVAMLWEPWWKRPRPGWLRPVFLLSLVFAFLPFRDFIFESNRYLFTVFAPGQHIGVFEDEISKVLWGIFAAWALVIVFLVWTSRVGIAVMLAIAVAFGNGSYFLHRVVPAHAEERSLRSYAELYASKREPDATLVFFGWFRYSLNYYQSDDFEIFGPDELESMISFVKDRPNVYIVAQDDFFDEMLERLHEMRRTRWTLIADDHPLFYMVSNTKARTLRKLSRNDGSQNP